MGQKLVIEASAEPTELQAEATLRFRLRIASIGAVLRPPLRPDLGKLANFKAAFQIEDLTPEDRVTELPGGTRQWDFIYRLRPRSVATKAIPAVRFVYYTPGRVPRAKGFYQTTYARDRAFGSKARTGPH